MRLHGESIRDQQVRNYLSNAVTARSPREAENWKSAAQKVRDGEAIDEARPAKARTRRTAADSQRRQVRRVATSIEAED